MTDESEQQFIVTKKEMDRINKLLLDMQKKIDKREKEDIYIRWGIFILMMFSIYGISSN